jgi:hypothetical protein
VSALPAEAWIDTRVADWLDLVNTLDMRRPPLDVPLSRWLNFLEDLRRFFDGRWLRQALALGWDEYQLFGCDREKPYARVDHQGLLWFTNCGEVTAMTEETADIVTALGAKHVYHARYPDPDLVCLPWQLGVLMACSPQERKEGNPA